MGLSRDTVFEVRISGRNFNGGGFVPGTGTDYSQQDAPQVTLTGAIVNSTTTTLDISGIEYSVASGDIGNLFHISNSGSATSGIYLITGVNTGSNQWHLDRSAGTIGQTGIGSMGGALLNPAKAIAEMTVAGMTTWIQSGTYDATSTIQTPNISDYKTKNFIRGYNTTRGDGGRPTILGPNGLDCLSVQGEGWTLLDLDIDGQGLSSDGIDRAVGAYTFFVHNCVVRNCSRGIVIANKGTAINCEVTGCSSNGIVLSAEAMAVGCNVHHNSAVGIVGLKIIRCQVHNNNGASSDGIQLLNNFVNNRTCLHNTVHNNGRDGIRTTAYPYMTDICRFNIATNNGGYGLNWQGADSPSPSRYSIELEGNAFRNNASGPLNNLETGLRDIFLTVDPYDNANGYDFNVNNNSGGGALLRNVADYNLDYGALQHQETGEPVTSGIYIRGRRILRGL